MMLYDAPPLFYLFTPILQIILCRRCFAQRMLISDILPLP